LRESQSAVCERVEIRRPHVPAVTPRIGEPHVIRDDEQDVRFPLIRRTQRLTENNDADETHREEEQRFHALAL
jgi:hypothetical protein